MASIAHFMTEKNKTSKQLTARMKLIIYLQRNHHVDYLTKKIIKIIKI